MKKKKEKFIKKQTNKQTLHGCFTKAEYDKAYPKGLKPRILYGSAKV